MTVSRYFANTWRRYCECGGLARYYYFHPSFHESSEKDLVVEHFQLYPNFINAKEENLIFCEVDKSLKKSRYQEDHWDAAIVGYRETEKKDWSIENEQVLARIRKQAFPAHSVTLPLVHVLDLKAEGEIRPHVDSVKFCGSTIAGLSLLSDAVMRLTHVDDPERCVDVLLPRRSLYIMSGPARYHYNHAILAPSYSTFNGNAVDKQRRISIICRNHPDP